MNKIYKLIIAVFLLQIILSDTKYETSAAKPGAPKTPPAKPVARKPVAPKPVAPKPVAPKPVAPKPVAPKPVAPKPVAVRTSAAKDQASAKVDDFSASIKKQLADLKIRVNNAYKGAQMPESLKNLMSQVEKYIKDYMPNSEWGKQLMQKMMDMLKQLEESGKNIAARAKTAISGAGSPATAAPAAKKKG